MTATEDKLLTTVLGAIINLTLMDEESLSGLARAATTVTKMLSLSVHGHGSSLGQRASLILSHMLELETVGEDVMDIIEAAMQGLG